METTLVPSLPASSFGELEKLLTIMTDVSKGFQIDIVDGKFVPHRSWPFTEISPKKELEKLGKYINDFEIEMDCMILHPEKYLDIFLELGVERVIIHVGSTNKYSEIVRHAHKYSYKIGFGFTNDVPLSFIYPYIGKIDFVQIMGISHVGQQGQPFDERTLNTVNSLRTQYPNLEIAVDGSVNKETIPRLLEAGVNRFAPGSAISKSKNPAKAYKELASLISPKR